MADGKKQLITNVGDVMFDAAIYYGTRAEKKSRILKSLAIQSKQFVLATVHRAENTDNPARLAAIMDALRQIGKGIQVILPLHPRTRKKIENIDSSFNTQNSPQITFIEPLGYLDMVVLEKTPRSLSPTPEGSKKRPIFMGCLA